ncbi:helix-turn-helix domain-containing protein [uncultured Arthrobacter sp.]|uniref:helix-turn-helix domain-containing protein n=1 Tax=uncultured Arthrobacter sp. TaxID=114050 RepID=UPI0025FB175A|nr:helix-turn-helix transcriptional regulator [uncultured Arthrobacter sp.]
MSVTPITSSVPAVSSPGDAIKSRRAEIGLSVSALAKRAGVDRGSLATLEAGGAVRDTTLAAVEKALSDLEHETGMDVPSRVQEPRGHVEEERGGIVRIRLENVFGATSAVVEAPADNPDALAAALDVLMRRMNERTEGEQA